MKLSFSTLGCPNWTFQKIMDEAEQMGFHGLEIKGVQREYDTAKLPYFKGEEWEKNEKLLKEHNLEIIMLNTAARFQDPEKWEAAVQEAKEAIDIAQSIGVRFVRIFGDRIPDPEKRDETLQLIAKGWTEVYRYSEGKDVTPLVETHGDFTTVEIFKDIFKYFQHPKFAVVYDIGHPYKIYERNFIEFFGFIRKYVRHVQIKDLKKIDGGWKIMNPGTGEIPIATHIMLLAASNYDGYVSLEFEKGWHDELDDAEIVFPMFVEMMKKILF